MIDFAPNTLGLKVLTPSGYRNFTGIAYMGDKPTYRLDFGNKKHLECSATHSLITKTGAEVVTNLQVGDKVLCKSGRMTKITKVRLTGKVEPVYDIVGVEGMPHYYTNGVLSHNCSFITDDETLINPLTLNRLMGVEPEFFTETARWFRTPVPNRTYIAALDPAVGTSNDYAAIQIFMLPEMEQVAEWQHNNTVAKGQLKMLMQMLMFLEDELRDNPEQSGEPEIYWTLENNSIGEAVLQIIEDTGEERIPGMFVSEKKRKGQVRRFRKGFNTDNRKKVSACVRFKSLVESGRMTIKSKQLIKELKNFVARGPGFAAKSGEHDDLTCSALLCVRMIDVVLNWMPDAGDLREYISDDELYENEPMPVVL